MKLVHAPQFRTQLLQWYGQSARAMPWRETTNPYPIWISEIMLQQTTVTAVIPYYHAFLAAFPTVEALAAADEQAVLHHWQGLGYYSRARNIHKCAKILMADYNGIFPKTPEELEKLPGIGPYTSNAIAAFAYNTPAAVLDGNVERVLTRLTADATPLPQAKPKLRILAHKMSDDKNSRLYNNAIMELGSVLCTPKNPKCLLCPVQKFCRAFADDIPQNFPVKSPKKARPNKHGKAYILLNTQGEIYLQQRSDKGLLANLWEVPHTGWEAKKGLPSLFGIHFKRAKNIGKIKHVFTHFSLELDIYFIETETPKNTENMFNLNNLPPLSNLIKKVLDCAKL